MRNPDPRLREARGTNREVGRRVRVFALLALAALGGCAAPGHVATNTARGGSVAPGTSVETGSDDALAAEGLVVVGTYAAASGRLCRRLAERNGRPVARASCRGADGVWRLGRALDGERARTARSLAVPSVVPGATEPDASLERAPDAAPAVGDTVDVALRAHETLWRFANRTTGDPRNWRRIARLNGIADTQGVVSGRTLSVPASIASPAL